ncbi:hypothetical protein [Traorella massiliensis]|uniref:hypothetical protein n=1 Tax=Traorella massiliensis TaxID=1903263 RepID=UPI0023549FF7|nr:hypothetical protein [Traorella massiliensis]
MQVKDIEAFYEVCISQKENVIQQEWEKLWNWFIEEKKDEYAKITYKEGVQRLVSEKNYNTRRNIPSSKALGFTIEPGDICYTDFGQAYLYEAGYQHFGLVIAIVHFKALIIPMTSNERTYKKSLTSEGTYLFPLGTINGLYKESVLFLNDAKFINTARIIDVKAHVPTNSKLFMNIKNRFKSLILE